MRALDTIYDVTTWSWVNLVHPVLPFPTGHLSSSVSPAMIKGRGRLNAKILKPRKFLLKEKRDFRENLDPRKFPTIRLCIGSRDIEFLMTMPSWFQIGLYISCIDAGLYMLWYGENATYKNSFALLHVVIANVNSSLKLQFSHSLTI